MEGEDGNHKGRGPTISVIVPTYGRPAHLLEALRSIETQTYEAAEVIVVDDCSPTPVTIPEELRVKVFLIRHLRNQGPGAARNTGLAHACGEWVLFLDDDDILMPERLQLAVEGMGQARIHAAQSEHFWPDRSTQVSDRRFDGDMRSSFLDGGRPFGGHPQIGQLVFHREDLLQFDPTLRRAQDTEWFLRLTDRAIFSWTPRVGIRIRRHGEIRPHYTAESLFHIRREIVLRHGRTSARRRRAHLLGGVAAAALVSGHRYQAVLWSVRALFTYPSPLALKRLAASLVPSRAIYDEI
jgi:glycosyltransferase involved in cell wall biosynthesis